MEVNALVGRIMSKAYWDVVIRPHRFAADRISYIELFPMVERASVRFRGWPVPLADPSISGVAKGEDWVGQNVDADVVSHYEAWRFYTSGQFLHLRAVSSDWRELTEQTWRFPGFESAIEVWEIVFYLTEVFEFAARLALTDAGDETIKIEVNLENLGPSRSLVVGQSGRHEFASAYPAPPAIRQDVTLGRAELVANARYHAADMSRAFLERFGWRPSVEQLLEHQQELVSGR